MWEIAIGALIVGGSAAWNVVRRRERLRGWREAAEKCGLSVVEGPSLGSWVLKARLGEIDVRLSRGGDQKQRVTGIEVLVPGWPGIADLRLRREPMLPWGKGRDVEVGDEAFDSTFLVDGPERLVRTLLDAQARRLLVSVNDRGPLRVSGSVLGVEVSDDEVPGALPLLVELGQRFAQKVDPVERLAENAHGDPQAGVRLRNLLLLARDFGGDPRTAAALRAACSDESPEIRLRAALKLGAEGRDVLLQLAEGRVDDALSAEAVASLGGELPFESVEEILARSRPSRQVQTARACLELLGRSRSTATVELLAEVMAHETEELAAAAARALAAVGEPAAEPPLIRALERDHPGLRVAAAEALGGLGSAAAVLPLKEATERLPRDRDLRRAARQAIAHIQSRLQGASPGQLSLAGTEAAGQLSLVQADVGQLSLATDPAGQLSLDGLDDDTGS